jgi:hypothetical protein
MKKQVSKNLFRRACDRTQKFVKAAAIGAALSLAAGCGARSVFEVSADSGIRKDADVVNVDTLNPKPDSGMPPTTYSYEIKNLIGDFLDRELMDRGKGLSLYPSAPETSPDSHPCSDGTGGALPCPFGSILHRIDGSMFPPFATTTITNNETGNTYSEQQDLWVWGHSHYSEAASDIVGQINYLAYSLKFYGSTDDFGIPVCTTPENTSDYGSCKGSGGTYDYATDSHKLKVKFLGEDWFVSEMSPPTDSLTNETKLVGGGYVKLAKESLSGILNKGEFLSVDNLKFQLDQLMARGDNTAAVFSVLDSNDNVLKKDLVFPGTTKEFTVYGKTYKFHVWNIAPGYTFEAIWANVSLLSHELKFQHGQSVDPDNDVNKHWVAYLGWKNKGASSTDPYPDHLRKIILFAFDPAKLSSGGSHILQVGDYIPILSDPSKFRFSYNGLTSTSANFDLLRFELESSDKFIAAQNGPGGTQCIISAPYVKVRSSQPGAFNIPGVSVSDDEFFVATSGGNCGGESFSPGALFIQASPASNKWVKLDYTQYMTLKYATAGIGPDPAGSILYSKKNGILCPNQSPDFMFGISEKAGLGQSDKSVDSMSFGLTVSGTGSFNIDISNPGFACNLKKDHVNYEYAGPVNAEFSNALAREGFITERGSRFTQIDKTLVEFKIAKTIVYSIFRLAY